MLFNINFSNYLEVNSDYAKKVGVFLRAVMEEQDAVLFQNVEQVLPSKNLSCTRRELHEAIFEVPSHGVVPFLTEDEIALSRQSKATTRHEKPLRVSQLALRVACKAEV